METSDVDRIAVFEQRFAQAQATDVVDLPWGFALLQRDFPDAYSHNRIVVTSDAPAAEILSTVDELLGGAGVQHRYVSVLDNALGQDLRSDFLDAGYEHEPLVTMIHSGREAEPPTHQVHPMSLDLLRPAIIRDWRVQLPDATDEVLAQLADRTALYSRGADVTLLAVFDGAEIAARADLYVENANSIAQLESLFTHPNFRGRGYGESLVREALKRSRSAGCELSFLEADLHDWPREWYSRLGYLEARRTHDFTRPQPKGTEQQTRCSVLVERSEP